MSTTALLKSASAAAKKIQAQQDAEVAFNWQNSAQTYQDYVDYSKYIIDRANQASDPSAQLTYATTLRSAQRSYTTNELQRQQMSIMEGNATTNDKMSAVKGLYDQAISNGDANLAQNLASQWDGLSIKLQNETEANLKAYAAAGKAAQTHLINSLTTGVNPVTLPTGQTVTPLSALNESFQKNGDTIGVIQAAQHTMDALRSVIIDQYQSATDQDTIDNLEQKYGAGLQDLDKKLTFDLGGQKLNVQDIVNEAANVQMNNPVYGLKAVHNEVTGQTDYKLQKNNTDRIDYTRQIDENGQEYYTPTTVRTDQNSLMFGSSDQGRSLNTQITDTGSVIGDNQAKAGQPSAGQINAGQGTAPRDSSKTIGNRLKSLGIIATQNGTTLQIKLPGENVERQATIQPDGSIRYFDDSGQIKEIGLVDRNLGSDSLPKVVKAGEQRVVAPDEISDFGTQSAFGGQLSQADQQGKKYITSILGGQPTQIGNLNGPVNVGNDFSGNGLPVTSALLQSAHSTQQQIQLQQTQAAMLQQTSQLQATPTFNLNQTPVQQFASNGVLKTQLQVAAPQTQQRIYVAPPAQTPKITSVSVAPTQKISGVGNYAQNYNLSVR